MPFMSWSDRLSEGVEALDNDHKKLIGMINELYDGIASGQNKEIIGAIIDRLVQYTRYHFAREEDLFASTGYANALEHKLEHDQLAEWAIQVELEFHKGTLPAPSLQVINRMKDWLFDHINGSDRQYTKHLNAHGIQ